MKANWKTDWTVATFWHILSKNGESDLSDVVNAKPTIWFWVLGVVILLWNLFGCSNYLMAAMATGDSLAAQGYTAEQVEFLLDMPALYLSIFALAVWSGLIAAILFLLRWRWAVPVFLFSLVFVAISFVLDFTAGTFEVLGPAYLGIMGVVLAFAIFEYFLRDMLGTDTGFDNVI